MAGSSVYLWQPDLDHKGYCLTTLPNEIIEVWVLASDPGIFSCAYSFIEIPTSRAINDQERNATRQIEMGDGMDEDGMHRPCTAESMEGACARR